jgi:plasmid stabilization system protein ParE
VKPRDLAYAAAQLAGFPLWRPWRTPLLRDFTHAGIVGSANMVPNYLVVYRVVPAAIEIVAVVHARRQYPR